MTLAQAQLAVAVVVALIATWAGLLMTVALLLPKQTNRAETALETTPKRCLVSGLLMLLLFGLTIILTNAPLPLMKIIGQIGMLFVSATLIVGGAGLSQLMGRRIAEMSGARTTFGTLVRGSILYSLAVGVPYIGWFLFAPLSATFALGAGILAILPRREARANSVPVFQEALK